MTSKAGNFSKLRLLSGNLLSGEMGILKQYIAEHSRLRNPKMKYYEKFIFRL